MRMKTLWLAIALSSLLATGCSSITNLTSTRQPRTASGLYPVEVAWDSREQSIRPESLTPSVVVGMQTFPMKATPLVHNRWETVIPIPADKTFVHYRFKFDYSYNAIPAPRKNSKLSPPYRLTIAEPKGNAKLPPGMTPEQEKAALDAMRKLK
ncbi:MAG: hypothetical protein JWN25_940 [Verrucomicrobiales bacterium]|nr:hypothetical protein [Verrucomicrobiales bacterium]MDB6130889.1 hypothetical protein [Verrucomicrobiales bacterium]